MDQQKGTKAFVECQSVDRLSAAEYEDEIEVDEIIEELNEWDTD